MKKFLSFLLTFLLLWSALAFSLQATAPSALPEGTTETGVIYEADFSQTSDLSNWTLEGVGPSFQWNPDRGSAKIENNELRVSSSGGTKVVTLPALGVTNYVYTMTATVNGSSGSFGLLADIKNPATSSGVAMHAITYVAGNEESKTIYHYNRAGSGQNTPVYSSAAQLLGGRVKAGDTVKMTLYCIDGMAYFYINDVYVSKNVIANATQEHDVVGIYTCGADISVSSVSVKELRIRGIDPSLKITDVSVRYTDENGATEGEKSHALRFIGSVDKTSSFYRDLVAGGTYNASDENVQFGILLLPTDLLGADGSLRAETQDVLNVPLTKILSQDDNTLTFSLSLFGIPKEDYDRSFTARMYARKKVGDTWEYVYAKEGGAGIPAVIATHIYESYDNEALHQRLDALYLGATSYQGGNAKRITFTVFSDFHYKEGMYISSIADMQTILDRADAAGSSLIIHAGDFCNDYLGSVELLNTYLNNNYGLPAYGLYGNHELESANNSMELVTPILNNCEVVWGTADGKISPDGSIGYYYFEADGFRFVVTDTNYSWDGSKWVHNTTNSYGPPSGNTKSNSLGPVQLAWLESVLNDAAEQGIPCILFSHDSFSNVWGSSPDAEDVQQLIRNANEKCAGTVLMVINGHHHEHHVATIDGVFYLSVNTTRNGAWRGDQTAQHYTNETFDLVRYDSNGNAVRTETVKITALSQAKNTWFFADPLSANVTVSTSGRIVIEGVESEWISGITPPTFQNDGEIPRIPDGVYYSDIN